MKTINVKSANAKAIKMNLKKFFGISALSCKMINGKMFLVVRSEDSDKTLNFLLDFDFIHASGNNPICFKSGKIAEFPNLYVRA